MESSIAELPRGVNQLAGYCQQNFQMGNKWGEIGGAERLGGRGGGPPGPLRCAHLAKHLPARAATRQQVRAASQTRRLYLHRITSKAISELTRGQQ